MKTELELRIALAEVQEMKGPWNREWNPVQGIESYYNTIQNRLPELTLDWVHEIEKGLTPLDAQHYAVWLHKLILGTLDGFDIYGNCTLECVSRVIHATASQRAEAILRTQGLWREG